ncbi:hypothetical protein B0T20DRAFT_345166 [Sordaria brevicollis]|uniref:Uncharacterized protein n=1 Tax=Sordaria brevicollis TaxID=83679 RepID=A0AAE0PLB1_SORBR|nr:hypothetical protein B0T20DRAFT_345166 [Sordaria brevicollis]
MSATGLKRPSVGNEDTLVDPSIKKRARSRSPSRMTIDNPFGNVDPFKMQSIKQQIDEVAEKIEKGRRDSNGTSSGDLLSFGSATPDGPAKATPAGQVDFGFGADTSGGAFTFQQRPVYMTLDDLPATPPKSGRSSPAPEAPEKKRSRTQQRAEKRRRQKLRELPERQRREAEVLKVIQERRQALELEKKLKEAKLQKEIQERRQAKQLQKKLNAIKNNSIPAPIAPAPLLQSSMEVDQPKGLDDDVEAWAVRLQDELIDAKAENASLQKIIEFLTAQVREIQAKVSSLTSMNEAALREVQAVRNAAARILDDRKDATVEDLRKFWESTARKNAPNPPVMDGEMDLTA